MRLKITFPNGAVQFESGIYYFWSTYLSAILWLKPRCAIQRQIDWHNRISPKMGLHWNRDPDHEDALPALCSRSLAQAVMPFPRHYLELVQPSKMVSYYDTDTKLVTSNEDLPRIEEEMKIAKENFPSVREEVTKDERRGEISQKTILTNWNWIGRTILTIYRQGAIWYLCRGPCPINEAAVMKNADRCL